MDPLITGSIIAGGTQLLGAGANAYAQGKMNKKTRKFAQEERRYQNEWNLDMWNRMNEYNTPAAQMERFEEAGLNPHLIYGKGTAGNATNAPSASQASWNPKAPQLELPNLMQAFSMYQDIRFKDEQIANQAYVRRRLDKAIELMDADIGLKGSAQKGQDLKNQLLDGTMEYQTDAWKIKVEKLKKEMDLIESRKGLSDAQKDWAVKRYETFRDTGIDIGRDNIWTRILENMLGSYVKEWAR